MDYVELIRRDAREQALERLFQVKKARGGKFKVNDRVFVEELENIWMVAELSAHERIMREFEEDKTLQRDDIRGLLHEIVYRLFNIMKKIRNLRMEVTLEDIIYGKHSTEVLQRQRGETTN